MKLIWNITLVLMLSEFVIASMVSAYRELTPFTQGFGLGQLQHAVDLSPRDVPLGISSFSRQVSLTDCIRVATSLRIRTRRSEVFQGWLASCQDAAMETTASFPTMAFAWCVAADASAELGERVRFNDHFQTCRKNAVNEYWLANMRFETATRHLWMLDDTSRANLDRDIAVMLSTEKGRVVLARRYVRQPGVRALISQIADQSTSEIKRAFLFRLKQAANS